MAALFDLTGKAALVTGGNGGIGLGMAQGLAAAGARVMIAGRDAEKNRRALEILGVSADAVAGDLAGDGAPAAVAATVERFGRLDILINNAGINIRKAPQDLQMAEWQAVLDTNLTAMFACCQAAYPHLKQRGGKIINIGSMTSLFGVAFAAPYGASKGAAKSSIRACSATSRSSRAGVSRQRASGLRRHVPVPEQGASTSTTSARPCRLSSAPASCP